MMKKTTLIRTLSVLAIGGIVLWGAKSLAGGEMHIQHKAVCRAILPANAVWNTALNKTGDVALVDQTETSHNVWEPDAGVATFSGDYRDGGCTFSCASNYNWNGSSCEAANICDMSVTCNEPDITIGSFTIKACNVGASTAGTGASSYGCYFQRGNNYGFANSGSIATSNSLVPNASSYGPLPLSYYSGSNFITEPGVSSSSKYDYWIGAQNNNLRGGSGDIQANGRDSGNARTERQGPCPDGYHVPSAGEWSGVVMTRWNAVGSGGASINTSSGLPYFNDSSKATQFRNDFRLPYAGYRNYDSSASVNYQGSYGRYWSSSPRSTYARNLSLYSSYVYAYDNYNRAYGFSLRCFQNS